MEGSEINNFVKVWLVVYLSLCYCYTVGKIMPKGIPRLLTILPIVCLFLQLPLNLHSVHLGGFIAFFIAWLANFKLLLFAFNKGPLSLDPSISLHKFIAIGCFPIKVKQNSEANGNSSPQKTQKRSKSPLYYSIKGLFLALLVFAYDYSDVLHPKMIMVLYCFHIYLALEIVFGVLAAMVQALLGMEVEPQFNEPYLSTSLQDFWGRRWNLMVTSLLRPTIYKPVLHLCSRIIPRKWAPLPATMATFIVSAIMHELIFYYLGRVKPTWEISLFFVLHGFCLMAEIVIKKAVNGRWRLPTVVSGPLTVVFVMVTVFWLFFPQFFRFKGDVRAFEEYAAVGSLAKDIGRALTVGVFNHTRS